MRKILIAACLGTSLGLALPALAQAPSIASRVEELGKPTSLTITDMRAVRRDRLLRVQVEISNSSSSQEQMVYRFKWLDQDGFSVWEEEPWKPVIVYGQQKKTISVTAPTFKATDFRLQIHAANNDGSSSSSKNSGSVLNQ